MVVLRAISLRKNAYFERKSSFGGSEGYSIHSFRVNVVFV